MIDTVKNQIASQSQYPPPGTSWAEYFEQLSFSSKDERLQQFYGAGVMSDDAQIANTAMVAMDFETTGLNSDTDEIVSIGIVPFSLRRIYCREAGHWVVKPRTALAQDSIVIHGITHSDIRSAPDLDEILEEVLTIMAGRLVVVHYYPIEREFLAKSLMSRIQESIAFPVIDTMEIENRIRNKQKTVMGRILNRGLPSLRLGDCRKRYQLPHYQAHHALTDAIATAELLQAQISHYFSPSTPVSELWV
ncbi:3'-5' exonuclease [Methylophaga sp. OBS3]|uniref:3'-5' exonuclease n=1 Tax=Methylophaga sp. OBS3 TaxID=2991934 RepID=UPI002251439A|nr:3'-5' exonuclease [Methylophaga sp. OBS3]MCX4190401.1 3'-5' exonuclease [Methylophaga sp. OBS3]